MPERVGEEVDLLGGADRDPDRPGAPKPASGRTITPCAQQPLEDARVRRRPRRRGSSPSAGPTGSSPCAPERRLELRAPRGVQRPPAGELGVVADARERRRLRGRRDVERAPHLAVAVTTSAGATP